MKTIIIWDDPDDYDNGTNRGSEIFDNDNDMMTWLNEKIKESPLLEFECFNNCRKIDIEPVNIVKSYRIK